MKSLCGLAAPVLLLISSATLAAQPQPVPLPGRDLSVRHEVQRAIDRGLTWLEGKQQPGGYWSTPDHPAITALALLAFQGNPDSRPQSAPLLEKGYDFILSCVQPDGGIYKKEELINYNTSLAMMALLAAENPEYETILRRARQFLTGLQVDFGEPGELDTPFDGGIGYGSYQHSDMANTLHALEALYYSRHLAADQPGADDLNLEAAIHFLQSCQNLPSHNKEPWASDDPANKGGFIYFPGRSMAGEMELPSGRVALRSYGSISYAGMLSYIYADLDRDDPRVAAVLEWLQNNYTLEENPGMGPQGLFYYYHTMAKALSVYGLDMLETADGREVNWRRELALKLIDLQETDGSWINESGRWWERDSALVTAYSIIALEMIYRGL